MANNFRNNSPVRTFTGSYLSYRSYKKHLAKDFFNRCGYTDCVDFWFGGKNNFHIDHFVPWKNYPANPALKTAYSNLVYCCSYVNILKSNDEGDYIDPCNVDFNQYFTRDKVGNIIPNPKSKEALKMYKQLKLHMKRYQIIWMLDNLENRMLKLMTLIENTVEVNIKNDLLVTQGELANLMIKYIAYLRKTQ